MNIPPTDDVADRTRVRVARLLDRQLAPLGLRAMETLGLKEGDQVADIGCGTGQTCMQLAKAVGSTGSVSGIDVSSTMVAAAKNRTNGLPQITITLADAQSFQFKPSSLDALYSRFGVMFFPDPVRAFTNLRGTLKTGGKIAFVCWRRLEDNGLDNVPLQAALPYLPAELTQNLDEAVHFSFSEPNIVQDIMTEAGFQDVQIASHDEAVSSGDLDSMHELSLSVGTLGKMVRENPELREKVSRPVRAALDTYCRKSDYSLDAAVWIVSAQGAPEIP